MSESTVDTIEAAAKRIELAWYGQPIEGHFAGIDDEKRRALMIRNCREQILIMARAALNVRGET